MVGSTRFHCRILRRSLVVGGLVTACLTLNAALAADTASSPALSPLRLVFGEEASQDQCRGMSAQVLEEVLSKRLGIEFSCETLPWPRAQLMVKDGERDAFLSTRTDERASYSVSSNEPVLTYRMRLFTSRLHPQLQTLREVKTLADLQPFVALTYRGDGWAKKHLVPAGIRIEWSESPGTVLRMLAAGRGDFYVQTDLDTELQIRRMKLDNRLISLPQEFGTAEIYLMIGKTSPYVDKLPAIDAALQVMKKDGSWQRIYQQVK
ncbi:transporter substrate-binding domain-containing protein [Permianibacter sp. IMCC34836]|uniref:substrate-binding periplasmic protein n=1 Tax=Permianibacter fluminis TaxID=2738515 RepID=UPI0015567F83|nr:transporter substrate-binding domain-containing protein [Permianibacter fluminis]NQD38865.1 transporter substrate-binding domain-containing protein [Permianibacter fluminis]